MRPVIFQETKLTVIVNGKPFTVAKEHENYQEIRNSVQLASDDDLMKLIYPKATAVAASLNTARPIKGGKVEVYDGNVWFKGSALHNVMVNRILGMHAEGLDIKPICFCLENLMQNPSAHSVADCYLFLEHNNLPLTPDGHFLAYKYVNEDYTDCHTSKIRNKVGDTPEVERNTVDDDWRKLCSSGLHVGSYEYAFDGPGRRRMVVKVNPRDVVAVVAHENKARVCKYEVVAELEDKKEKLPDYVHSYDDPEDDDDYDDDDYDDYDSDCNDDIDYCDNCGEEEDDCYCGDDTETDDEDCGEEDCPVCKTDTRQNHLRQRRGPNGRFA